MDAIDEWENVQVVSRSNSVSESLLTLSVFSDDSERLAKKCSLPCSFTIGVVRLVPCAPEAQCSLIFALGANGVDMAVYKFKVSDAEDFDSDSTLVSAKEVYKGSMNDFSGSEGDSALYNDNDNDNDDDDGNGNGNNKGRSFQGERSADVIKLQHGLISYTDDADRPSFASRRSYSWLRLDRHELWEGRRSQCQRCGSQQPSFGELFQ